MPTTCSDLYSQFQTFWSCFNRHMALFQRCFSNPYLDEWSEPYSGSRIRRHPHGCGNSIHHPNYHPDQIPSTDEAAGGSFRLHLAMQKVIFFILWFRPS
jgi:hypothetical protein